MTALLEATLAFPTVIFTVLLLVATLWWLLVVLGLFDIEIPGLDDLDLDVDDPAPMSTALASLGLSKVPVAVGTSLVIFFAWLFTLLGLRGLSALAPGLATGVIVASLVALAALILGAVAGGLVARAIAPAFVTVEAPGRHELIGKACRISSPEANATTGRAELDDGAAGLILDVRRPAGAPLRRGEEAVIYDYDPHHEVFLVAPMGDPAAPVQSSEERPS
jgi:hypothetical protein